MPAASERYTRTAILLHWLIALLIIIAFPVGLYMADLPLSPQKLQIYSWHKWAGITVLVLAILRVLWRLSHRPPALPDGMKPLEKLAAHGAHYILYVLMIAVPLAGWLMSSAKGVKTVWFGLLPLPDLLEKNKELGETLGEVHEILAWVMIIVVVVHAAAAIKHHFMSHDGVLARMLPFLNSR